MATLAELLGTWLRDGYEIQNPEDPEHKYLLLRRKPNIRAFVLEWYAPTLPNVTIPFIPTEEDMSATSWRVYGKQATHGESSGLHRPDCIIVDDYHSDNSASPIEPITPVEEPWLALVRKFKLSWTQYNNGLHVRIYLDSVDSPRYIDYWPTTERWRASGIDHLLKANNQRPFNAGFYSMKDLIETHLQATGDNHE